jgi:signal transduction histidine kinase
MQVVQGKKTYHLCSEKPNTLTMKKNLILMAKQNLFRCSGKIINALFAAVVLFLANTNIYAQYANNYNLKVDSLEHVLETNPPTGAELLRIYSDLSSYYTRNYVPEKNREYALKGIELARRLHNQYEEALLYNNLGSAYDDLSRYDSAIIHYETALHLIEEMENKKQESAQNIGFLKGTTYANTGNLYNVQGLFDQAIKNYIEAITLFERFNITDKLAKVYRNISLVYINMNNYEQAIHHLNKSAEINKILLDSLALASTLTRLGHVYLNQFKYPEALQCVDEAEKIYAKSSEKRDLRIYNLRVLCAIWNNGFKNDRKAMEYAQMALEESEKTGLKLEVSRSLQTIAATHLEYKRYYQAKQTAIEALQTDSSNLTNNILLYECLIIANAGVGDVNQTQAYFDLYKRTTTAYSNQNFQSSLSEMEVKYEAEKKEMLIASIKKENSRLTWLSITGGGLLIFALAVLLLLWRLTMQKKHLAEQQIKQLQQEKQLTATQALLDGEVQERSRIARDLHDSLGSILAAAKYNLVDIKNTPAQKNVDVERFDKALGLLDESMQEMRRVAHHLMPESLGRLGLKQAVTDFCNSVPHVKFKWYGEETRFDQKIEVMLYRIMHELVSNALKHSGASHILVEIVRYADHIILTVQDNGCGFDCSAKSKGMGLANIHARVAAYNGTLHIDSEPEVGTEVNVELLLSLS